MGSGLGPQPLTLFYQSEHRQLEYVGHEFFYKVEKLHYYLKIYQF